MTSNSDVEWKFARTQIWMDYFDGRLLPPPFNILPSVQSVLQKTVKLINRDRIDTKESRKNNQLLLDYSCLQDRLIKGVFAKAKQAQVNDKFSEIQKAIKKLFGKIK